MESVEERLKVLPHCLQSNCLSICESVVEGEAAPVAAACGARLGAGDNAIDLGCN